MSGAVDELRRQQEQFAAWEGVKERALMWNLVLGIAIDNEAGKDKDMSEEKTQYRAAGAPVAPQVHSLATVAGQAIAADRPAALSAVADAERALKRIITRATPLPAGYERIDFVQTRGPVVEFSGRLLAETEFETRGRVAMTMKMEVWQTIGGAYVAVSSSVPLDRDGFEDSRVTVVAPCGDEMARRCAVMAAFEWNDRARSMVRKALGWSLRMEVE